MTSKNVHTSRVVVVHADPVKLEIGLVALVAGESVGSSEHVVQRDSKALPNSPSIVLDAVFVRDNFPELGT